MDEKEELIINGWRIYMHPAFLDNLNELIEKVSHQKQKFPESYKTKNAFKRLTAIRKLAFEVIPQNPFLPEYRQGNTLGEKYRHWFRAKFFQQYRLFFRYREEGKILVLGWVNDESTKRAYDSKSDAYAVFSKMLQSGHPPDDWEELMKASESKQLVE